MKTINNQVFLPNVGEDNFYPNSPQLVEDKLSALSSADYPTIASLGYTPTRGTSEGMIPIKNKPKR
jgi:hypothetical protein